MKKERKLNWIGLRTGLCPSCGYKLQAQGLLDTTFVCTMCDFRISQDKYNQVVRKIIEPKNKFKMDNNLSELNNLGVEGKKLLEWGVEPEE